MSKGGAFVDPLLHPPNCTPLLAQTKKNTKQMNTVAAMAKDPDAPLRPGDDVDAARWARLSELDAMGGRRARACGRHCWGRKGREGLPFLAFVRTWPLQEAGDVAHFFAHCGSTRPPTSHFKHPPPHPHSMLADSLVVHCARLAREAAARFDLSRLE